MAINNGVLLQFGQKDTKNKVITYPIAFTLQSVVIGVGFVIESVGQQFLSTHLTYFSTSSNVKNCGTAGWLAIGV